MSGEVVGWNIIYASLISTTVGLSIWLLYESQRIEKVKKKKNWKKKLGGKFINCIHFFNAFLNGIKTHGSLHDN